MDRIGKIYNSDMSLPGAELVERGLRDLRSGAVTAEALLVAIGEPRLRRLGVEVPAHGLVEPEHRLYELLSADDPDAAHARYNALIRRLVSYERALGAARATPR